GKLRFIKAKTLQAVEGFFQSQAAQQANGYEVAGAVQALARTNGTGEFTGVIFAAPGHAGSWILNDDRGIIDDGSWGETIFKSSRVEKRLKGRARLPGTLHRTIKVALAEVKTAYQREYGSILGIERDQRALHGRNLG